MLNYQLYGLMLWLGTSMKKLNCVAAIVVAALAVAVALDPAMAASKKKAKQRTSNGGSIQATCMKQVGAYYIPGEGGWQFAGGLGTAQQQAYYDCVDSHTRGSR